METLTQENSKINLRKIRREARLPGLRIAEKVKTAANALLEANWLLPQPEKREVGRPGEDYTVNTKLWEVLL
jgi:hypothetical protein